MTSIYSWYLKWHILITDNLPMLLYYNGKTCYQINLNVCINVYVSNAKSIVLFFKYNNYLLWTFKRNVKLESNYSPHGISKTKSNDINNVKVKFIFENNLMDRFKRRPHNVGYVLRSIVLASKLFLEVSFILKLFYDFEKRFKDPN